MADKSKCAVPGCPNTRGEGEFCGDVCAACSYMFESGVRLRVTAIRDDGSIEVVGAHDSTGVLSPTDFAADDNLVVGELAKFVVRHDAFWAAGLRLL